MRSTSTDTLTAPLRPRGARSTARTRPRRATPRRPAIGPARLLAALLCLAVAAIHVKDQGGFPGHQDAAYLQDLYYALEAGAVATAVLLLVPVRRVPWAAALAVALCPLVGYVLSRGPGLPGATDDKGNWTETLGVVSLVVEAALAVLAMTMLAAGRRRAPAGG